MEQGLVVTDEAEECPKDPQGHLDIQDDEMEARRVPTKEVRVTITRNCETPQLKIAETLDRRGTARYPLFVHTS